MTDAARTLFVTDPNQKPTKFDRLRNGLPRILFLILVIVVAVELVLAGRKLLSPVPKADKNTIKEIQGGEIRLSSDKYSYAVGEKFFLKVNLFTGGTISGGADVILAYDPSKLTALKSDLVAGTIYEEYPLLEVDQSQGLIKVSGISGPKGTGFIGSGVLATVGFSAKAAGAVPITVEFKPNQTNDSNITSAKDNQDILKQVYSMEVTIR